MTAYPQAVRWADGTRTVFGSKEEHGAQLARCSVAGHSEQHITISGGTPVHGCVNCLTTGAWQTTFSRN